MSTLSTGLSDAEKGSGDIIWGAAEIGATINRSASQVYYLHRIGALDGCVAKLGPKLFIGSRRKLQALFNNLNK